MRRMKNHRFWSAALRRRLSKAKTLTTLQHADPSGRVATFLSARRSGQKRQPRKSGLGRASLEISCGMRKAQRLMEAVRIAVRGFRGEGEKTAGRQGAGDRAEKPRQIAEIGQGVGGGDKIGACRWAGFEKNANVLG